MARASNLVRTAAVAAACAAFVLSGCSHSSKKGSAAGRSSTTTSTAGPSTTTTLAPATTAPPSSGQTIRLGDADKGKSVAAHPGDSIVLTLTDCFSCGYQWNVTTAPAADVVAHRSTEDKQANTAPGAVGGSGSRVFTFEALRAGTTKVVLGYFPPAKGAQPQSTYDLTFSVS